GEGGVSAGGGYQQMIIGIEVLADRDDEIFHGYVLHGTPEFSVDAKANDRCAVARETVCLDGEFSIGWPKEEGVIQASQRAADQCVRERPRPGRYAAFGIGKPVEAADDNRTPRAGWPRQAHTQRKPVSITDHYLGLADLGKAEPRRQWAGPEIARQRGHLLDGIGCQTERPRCAATARQHSRRQTGLLQVEQPIEEFARRFLTALQPLVSEVAAAFVEHDDLGIGRTDARHELLAHAARPNVARYHPSIRCKPSSRLILTRKPG